MKSIVLVPCYQRAELLAICLEQIRKADDCPERIVCVIDDHAGVPPHKDVLQVVKEIGGNFWRIKPHRYRKNSFAVLTALQSAHDDGADWIYYIEEDVFIGKDFFRWHLAVHADGNYFASVACKNNCNTRAIEPLTDPAAYYTSRFDYSALGVCLPRRSIPAITEHARPEYFSDMTGYVSKTFPRSTLNNGFSEQDGLIRRVVEAGGHRVAWPYVPRAFHIGWYGSNRNGRHIVGNLEERIRQVRATMQNGVLLNQWSHSHKDIEPVSLDGHDWIDLMKHAEY